MYENEFEKYDIVQFFKEYLREREKEVFIKWNEMKHMREELK